MRRIFYWDDVLFVVILVALFGFVLGAVQSEIFKQLFLTVYEYFGKIVLYTIPDAF